VIDRIAADIQKTNWDPTPIYSGVSFSDYLDALDWRSDGAARADKLKMVGWPCPLAARPVRHLCRGDAPLAPSRRNFIRSMGSLAVVALPAWMAGAPAAPDFIVVDGWILAKSDLR
jgi:hypothetical protein